MADERVRGSARTAWRPIDAVIGDAGDPPVQGFERGWVGETHPSGKYAAFDNEREGKRRRDRESQRRMRARRSQIAESSGPGAAPELSTRTPREA